MKGTIKEYFKKLSPVYRKLDWIEGRINTLQGAFSKTFEGQAEILHRELRKCEINEKLLGQGEGNELLRQHVMNGGPFLAGRLGGTEIIAMYYYHLYDWRHWRAEYDDEKQKSAGNLSLLAGFFPSGDEQLIRRFCQAYADAMKELDYAGLWNFVEQGVRADAEIILHQRYFPHAAISYLFSISSYLHENPWSAALKGKRVLVIHPFEKSIRRQYEKRAGIFPGSDVLPEFGSLEIVRSVQSIMGNTPPEFHTWFDALTHMEDEISRHEFDVALIGAGAYGLPLAAHVKRMGKTAMHMGGELQMLFGIKGQRWAVEQGAARARFFNENWVFPLEEERPPGWESVEGGAYW